jgi:hypothetical protein
MTDHPCSVCGSDRAPFGYGPADDDAPLDAFKWFCMAHRPDAGPPPPPEPPEPPLTPSGAEARPPRGERYARALEALHARQRATSIPRGYTKAEILAAQLDAERLGYRSSRQIRVQSDEATPVSLKEEET